MKFVEMKNRINGRRKLAVDLDGVLAEYFQGLVKYYNGRFGTKFSEDDVFTLDLCDVFGVPKGEEREVIMDFFKTNDFRNIPVVVGSREAINILSEEHELVIVTARPKSTYDDTWTWLDRNYPGKFNGVHFASHHFPGNGTKKNKSDFCLEHGYGILIDDYHGHVNECAEKGITSFLMTRPWNWETLHQKVIRVRNWQDAVEKINIARLSK